MTFKQKLDLVREYKKWVERENEKHGFNLCDNHETFLAFLETKNLLVEVETWEGYHNSIVMPKGTFDKVFKDAFEGEDE